jgi:hypothetical protein
VTVVVADPPAETDVGEGAGAEIAKPGGAAPVPDKTIFCGLPEALSVIVMLPARLPVAVGVNVTEIWQLPPAARDVLQVLVSPKSPDAAIPVMLSALVPVLVKVTIWGLPVVPTVCEAKVNEFGLKSAIGPSPVPVKLADCGLPGAVSVTARLAVRDPAAFGVKVTLAVQLPPAGKELPQLFVCVKSELSAPVTPILLMLMDAFPVFTSTRVTGVLLVPTACGAKFARPGYGVRKGPFTPLPLSGMARGLILVLSVTVMAPDSRPLAVGEKVTFTAQWAPGTRLAPQSLVWVKLLLATMLAMLNFTVLGLLIVIV